MSRRSKRAKAGTSERYKNNEEDSTPGDCPNFLVFDTVIRSLKCPKLLGRCRLVCKSWNESACAVLRKLLTLSLFESGPNINWFKEIMEARQFNVENNLPQIFSKVRLLGCLTEPSYLAILHNWDAELMVTDLGYFSLIRKHHKQISQRLKELHSLLLSHADSLSSLSLQCKDLASQEFDFAGVRLRKLKTFEVLLGENSPSCASRLLEEFLAQSSLDHLKLMFKGSSSPCLRALKLENVPTVELEFDTSLSVVDDNPLPTFRNIPLANLKIVKFYLRSKQSSPEEVSQVLSQWSETVEVIKVEGAKVDLDLLPPCSKLKEILSSDGYLGQFDPDKFPSLKKVSSFTPQAAPEEPLSHPGVYQLEFIADKFIFSTVFGILRHNRRSYHEDLCNTLAKFGRQFPNLTDFSCEIRATRSKTLSFSAAVLKAIQSSFLHLRNLRINGWFEDFPKCSRGGHSKNNDARPTHPMADFEELERLHLGNGIKVTPALIRQGLGKMPKLKHLKFYKCKDLTEELIRECLGHLGKIEIHNCKEAKTCGSQLSNEEKLKLLDIFPGVIDFFYKCETRLDVRN